MVKNKVKHPGELILCKSFYNIQQGFQKWKLLSPKPVFGYLHEPYEICITKDINVKVEPPRKF